MNWFETVERPSDVPGLESLRDISENLGVKFTLVGSICRRIVLARAFPTQFFPESLFDLVPFTSDIDLVHSGHEIQTIKIQEAILELVPFAEAFRWQIFSIKKFEKYDTFLTKYAHKFPDMYLRFNDTGILDANVVETAYRTQQFSFTVNGEYDSYQRSGVELDNEMFSALLYLRNLAEIQGYGNLPSISPLLDERQFKNVSGVIETGAKKMQRLNHMKYTYLETRLTYLLWAFASACPSTDTWNTLTQASGLRQAMADLSESPLFAPIVDAAHSIAAGNPGVTISSRVNGGGFRAPDLSLSWSSRRASLSDTDSFLQLRPGGDELILRSGRIQIDDGEASCSEFANCTHEFICLTAGIDPTLSTDLANTSEADLSVGLVVPAMKVDGQLYGAVIALPAVVDFRYGKRSVGGVIRIRINTFGLLKELRSISRRLENAASNVEVIIVRSYAQAQLQGGFRVSIHQSPLIPVRA